METAQGKMGKKENYLMLIADRISKIKFKLNGGEGQKGVVGGLFFLDSVTTLFMTEHWKRINSVIYSGHTLSKDPSNISKIN